MPRDRAHAAGSATLIESAIVRPKPRAVLAAALLLTLSLAGNALAGNGGFAPVSPESPNAQSISDAYWLIMGFTGAVFLIVEGALILFIVRFRSRGRGREVEGPQIRGNTNLEIAWTVLPVLILAAIAAFVFYKLPGIKNTPSARAGETLHVTVVAHQFYWEFRYPNGRVSIDDLVVPASRVVTLDVESEDVAHSWWIPALGGKIDALPGRTNHTWFKPAHTGTYRGQCAELCGLQHAAMLSQVRVVPAREFRRFLATHAQSSVKVGMEEWTGVCAKCHGLAGQGDVGPPIAGNPILTDRVALSKLVHEGLPPAKTSIGMPAVGAGWSQAQVDALVKYVKTNPTLRGAASGG
jgi:cytochrome c oxidase subunit II